MVLTAENYYSQEANEEYMSVSQFKDFCGTYGKMPCEFTAMEKLNGRWEEPKSKALMVGSYVDSYFEGTLDKFKAENPDLFKRDGTLKAEFVKADEIIQRIERDDYFMKFMSGKKQVIMTGELFGTKWKIKMDSYIPDIAIVDLKVMASITKLEWVRDIGYLDFVRYWGYDIQGAIYQEIVRQNTGKKLPFYIAGATKESEPDIRIIHITDNYLAEALNLVEMNMARVLAVKTGNAEPDRCELCDCCRKTRVLKAPMGFHQANSIDRIGTAGILHPGNVIIQDERRQADIEYVAKKYGIDTNNPAMREAAEVTAVRSREAMEMGRTQRRYY